jgi:hypothetical protein
MTKWCHLGDSDSADTTRLQHLQAMSSLEFLLFSSTGFLHPTWSDTHVGILAHFLSIQ